MRRSVFRSLLAVASFAFTLGIVPASAATYSVAFDGAADGILTFDDTGDGVRSPISIEITSVPFGTDNLGYYLLNPVTQFTFSEGSIVKAVLSARSPNFGSFLFLSYDVFVKFSVFSYSAELGEIPINSFGPASFSSPVINPAVVPIPPSGVILAAGLAGLATIRRRNRNSA